MFLWDTPSAKRLLAPGRTEQSRGRLSGFYFVLLNDILGHPHREYWSASRRSKPLTPMTWVGLDVDAERVKPDSGDYMKFLS